jgi:ATP-dependent Lhr-like helicase
VQRRPNLRRLPKWRRPDLGGAPAGWVGRWSLVARQRGSADAQSERGEHVARQWLDRYGIVARNWYQREKPEAPWRAIYGALKRMEYTGEVRRGYFVKGLAGAQFALPEAVERLRAATEDGPDVPFVAMSSSDPANAHVLPLYGAEPEALGRTRGGAVLVTRRGMVILRAERRGSRVTVREETDADTVTGAAREWLAHVARGQASTRRRRDITIETIDGVPALRSPHADALRAAGFRLTSDGLRWYAAI